MQKTLFIIRTALFLFLGTFVSAAGSVQAQTVNLPLQYEHDGLTFNEPITYTTPAETSPLTIHLTFNTPQEIHITSFQENQTTDEVVVLPTIPTVMTLSVLPDQQPPAVFKDEDETEATVSPTPTNKPEPTTNPTATLSSTPSNAPTTPPTTTPVTQPTNAGGLDPEKLFNMSNAYRQSRGLPAFQKDERACSLAASRAPEIAAEVASGTMHAGLRARALPYWNTENIISMRTEEAAFTWWINDKIHHDAIVGNYTYSCVACSGNSCAQEFTNFQSK